MMITLTPNTETRLRRKAARTGQEADTLAEAILSDALPDEVSEEGQFAGQDAEQYKELRAEYRQLAASEMRGTLSEAMASRLEAVTREMDALDMNSPAARTMFQPLRETDQKMDEMLTILRGLPLAEEAR